MPPFTPLPYPILSYPILSYWYERLRAERDNQVLQAAGRALGPDNDAVRKFKELWVAPGLCDEGGRQLLL